MPLGPKETGVSKILNEKITKEFSVKGIPNALEMILVTQIFEETDKRLRSDNPDYRYYSYDIVVGALPSKKARDFIIKAYEQNGWRYAKCFLCKKKDDDSAEEVLPICVELGL
jgi:hypothetical protein